MANQLKLRIAMRLVKVAPTLAEQYATEAVQGGTDHTGHCDMYWRVEDAAGTNVYIPAGSGGANYGSYLGVSVLGSINVLSFASLHCGSALASDDPTDTIPDGTVAA